jgi:N4-gp56 family major capsid protein
MAINLATKYDTKLVAPYTLGALSDAGGNKDYEWAGVKTVTVVTLTSQALGDYTRTGTSRYGTPTELQDTKQDMTLTKDRSFSITVDAGNNNEQMMIKEAGKVLKMQMDEQYLPELDTYRFATQSAAAIAAGNTATTAVTASNAYLMLLNANANMDNGKVPMTGRIAYVTPAYYNFLKQDSTFVKASDIAQNMLIKGQVGEVDGVKIVKVPSSYLPASHAFILVHPSATVFCNKLKDFKIHNNPMGVNGNVIEGRFIYDCFPLTQKAKGLWAHKIA